MLYFTLHQREIMTFQLLRREQIMHITHMTLKLRLTPNMDKIHKIEQAHNIHKIQHIIHKIHSIPRDPNIILKFHPIHNLDKVHKIEQDHNTHPIVRMTLKLRLTLNIHKIHTTIPPNFHWIQIIRRTIRHVSFQCSFHFYLLFYVWIH